MAKTAEKDTIEKPIDHLPDVEPDGEFDDGNPASQETPDKGVAKAEEADAEKVVEEDPRAAIARKYRENRDRSNTAEDDDNGEPEQAAEPDVKESEAKKLVAEPVKAAPTEQPKDEEPKYTLKVYGREVQKSLSEVIALAQQAEAAGDNFGESKQLLKEVRALRDSLKTEHRPEEGEGDVSQKSDQSQKDKTAGVHQPQASLDPEKLKAIVERIQVGDTEEGALALQEFVEMTRNSNADLTPDKIGSLVKQHIVQTKTEDEINEALAGFVKEFPVLARDEVLAEAGRTVLRMELVKDLKSVGASDADIDQIKHDARALAAAQRNLRAAGHKVRSYGEILGAVGKTMTERFNIQPESSAKEDPSSNKTQPQPRESASSKERVDRKRAATQQPRAAGVRGQVQQAPRPKSRADVVADMRKLRGFE